MPSPNPARLIGGFFFEVRHATDPSVAALARPPHPARVHGDFLINPPIPLTLADLSLRHGTGPFWRALFAAGWVFWTLYEYAVHRRSHHALWL